MNLNHIDGSNFPFDGSQMTVINTGRNGRNIKESGFHGNSGEKLSRPCVVVVHTYTRQQYLDKQ
jgi:hypothetical protein